MPELPEVETVRAGLQDLVCGQTIRQVEVFQPRLRYPIEADFSVRLVGHKVLRLARRAKYLLFELERKTLLVHLGMSGSLRWSDPEQPRHPHDHVEILFDGAGCLRYRDPRRFGLLMLASPPVAQHPLLRHLGPEPLSDEFNSVYLFEQLRRRKTAIKNLIMDNRLVVGVGNIYANEALFACGLSPYLPGASLSSGQCLQLVTAIKQVLRAAIAAGGTTLQDFVNGRGNPGYFQQQLYVYGRAGEACLRCGEMIENGRSGQRSTFYCPRCQAAKES